MQEYFYELTITTHNPQIIAELVLEITNEAIEEQDNSIIVRSKENLDDIQWAIEEFGKKAGIPLSTKLSKKKNEDWIKKYQESIKPIQVGSFYIRPSWETPKKELIDIIINPALAFGSGHHETTSSCLEAIEKYVKENDKVLDVGCGSGILSIAAAKLNAKVDICDTDPLAVESAKENFKLNKVSFNKAWVGSVNDTEEEYDTVIANIIADILIILSKDLKQRVKKNGYLILSGILDKYIDEVKKKFDNFDTIATLKKAEWFTLVLKNSQR